MQLIGLGLNHRTAPVEIREKFSLSQARIIKWLEKLGKYSPLQEAVVLSTCNRSEIYLVADSNGRDDAGLKAAREFLADITDNSGLYENFKEFIYTFIDEECVRHLMRVASSLDSLVIGEGQILSQVKHAYTIAKDHGTTSTVLNLLFHRAITTGKKVRTETRIAYNAVSVSYAAVELAKSIFPDLSNCRALLFGAGKMAELTATHLVSNGLRKLYIANRHLDKAEALANKYNGEALELSEVYQVVNDMDIIITSTGAPHYVVRTRETQEALSSRTKGQLVLIDIAVPRDVEPEVADLEGVTLYNIDDLEAVVDDNLHEREQEAVRAEAIVEDELQILLERFQYLPLQPLMAELSARAEAIRSREVKRAMSKLPDINEQELRAIENMTHMIVRKILREPMTMINQSAGTEHEQYVVKAMLNLFNLTPKEASADDRK